MQPGRPDVRGPAYRMRDPAVLRAGVQGELLAISTSQVIAARDALGNSGLPDIIELQVYGDLLHVFVKDARAAEAPLQAALQAAGVPVAGIHRAQPRVEEAFISLIRRQQGEGSPRKSS